MCQGKNKQDEPIMAAYTTKIKSRISGKVLTCLSKPEGQTRLVKVYGIPGVKKFTMVVTNGHVELEILSALVDAGYGHLPEESDHYSQAAIRSLKRMSK